jgi:hypothetical protein
MKLKTLDQLLKLYCEVLRELRRRKFSRSENNPAGDIAETLVACALDLKLVANSKAGYDAVHADGTRFQIKGRRITTTNPSRQLSTMRGLENKHFDYLAGVIFDQDFRIFRAALIPHLIVEKIAKHQKHVNGARFELKDHIWEAEGVIDITNKLKITFHNLQSEEISQKLLARIG